MGLLVVGGHHSSLRWPEKATRCRDRRDCRRAATQRRVCHGADGVASQPGSRSEPRFWRTGVSNSGFPSNRRGGEPTTTGYRDSLCSFEVLIEDYKLGADPALALMAQVVHGADVSDDRDATPQSPGLLAIADGFALLGECEEAGPAQMGEPHHGPSLTW